MNKKHLILIFLMVLTTISYSQTKVLVIGFPEKNFFSEWKPKEKLAKKNSTTVDKVDDLYRNGLLDAIKNTEKGIEYIIAKKGEEELFSNCIYSVLKNSNQKEYFGTNSFDEAELTKIFDEYNVHYIIHISQYRMFMSMGLNLHTKIVHRFDYQLIDRKFNILSADRFKFSGFFQGAFRPDGVRANYANKARTMHKRLSVFISD